MYNEKRDVNLRLCGECKYYPGPGQGNYPDFEYNNKRKQYRVVCQAYDCENASSWYSTKELATKDWNKYGVDSYGEAS